MTGEKLTELEGLVAALLEKAKSAEERNLQLEKELGELKAQMESALEGQEVGRRGLQELVVLENANKKLKDDRVFVRQKIQNILDTVEKLNWI